MTTRIAVVGASGRVGSAICSHLRPRYDVVEIGRRDGETVGELTTRATANVDLVINAAGMAHVEHPTPADLERLQAANVELPAALADAALRREIPMIHISSVKAVPDAPTPYGRSKFEGDQLLDIRFGPAFVEANLGLVIIRPLALLLPPFDAGKLSKLRFLRWWPSVLTLPVGVPVLATETFLGVVEWAARDAIIGVLSPGVVFHDFDRGDRGTLRDVAAAMRNGGRRRTSAAE